VYGAAGMASFMAGQDYLVGLSLISSTPGWLRRRLCSGSQPASQLGGRCSQLPAGRRLHSLPIQQIGDGRHSDLLKASAALHHLRVVHEGLAILSLRTRGGQIFARYHLPSVSSLTTRVGVEGEEIVILPSDGRTISRKAP
jgi:hypothetical protein